MSVLGIWELPEEDSPPEEILGHDRRLKEWFEGVKERRRQRFGGSEPMEEVPMMQNELTKDWK